jgi:hypothetical protein
MTDEIYKAGSLMLLTGIAGGLAYVVRALRRIMSGETDLQTQLAAVDTDVTALTDATTALTNAATNIEAAIATLKAGGISDADAEAMAQHLQVTLGQFQQANAALAQVTSGLTAATPSAPSATTPPATTPPAGS